MNQVMTVEVADFVEAVDAALVDLPADVRAELLEDLPAHLADVLADGGTPSARLGTPAAYAAELRSAAGFPPAESSARRGLDLSARLQTADTRLGHAVGYPRFSDFARALRPAWWLVRAFLVVQVLTGAVGRYGTDAILPLVDDRLPLGIPALVVACAVSIWVGRRTHGQWALLFSVAVGLALVVYAVNLVDSATASNEIYIQDGSSGGGFDGVTNIYPIGSDGKQLTGVRLYDQNGQLISVPSDCTYDPATGAEPNGDPVRLYPIVCANEPGPFQPGEILEPAPGNAPATTTAPSAPVATPSR